MILLFSLKKIELNWFNCVENRKAEMAGGAAGGFVARAFESMLKECANKKYSALQSAIKTYLGTHFWKLVLFFDLPLCIWVFRD